jgi:amidohydrolase
LLTFLQIHSHPELGYAEHHAHETLTTYLRSQGLEVTPHAFNLPTAFLSEFGSGGRVVAFNAEYDALPDIGHACGHNLIAMGSLAAYLSTVAALKASPIPGRVRLLGTPAEEGGGGKLRVISAGAYEDVDACLMTHPYSPIPAKYGDAAGVAYGTCAASVKFTANFTGKPAHAAATPFEGVNALDAAVLAYNGISMLRQQIRDGERIQGVILEGGTAPNIITSRSLLSYNVRSSTIKGALELHDRVVKCFEGAAVATGCKVEFQM